MARLLPNDYSNMSLDGFQFMAWIPAGEANLSGGTIEIPNKFKINPADGEWHTFKVAFQPDHLICWIDNVEIDKTTGDYVTNASNGGRFNGVQVFIQTYNTKFDIKEFVITQTDDTESKFGFAPAVVTPEPETPTPTPTTPTPTPTTPAQNVPTGDNGSMIAAIALLTVASILALSILLYRKSKKSAV